MKGSGGRLMGVCTTDGAPDALDCDVKDDTWGNGSGIFRRVGGVAMVGVETLESEASAGDGETSR